MAINVLLPAHLKRQAVPQADQFAGADGKGNFFPHSPRGGDGGRDNRKGGAFGRGKTDAYIITGGNFFKEGEKVSVYCVGYGVQQDEAQRILPIFLNDGGAAAGTIQKSQQRGGIAEIQFYLGDQVFIA